MLVSVALGVAIPLTCPNGAYASDAVSPPWQGVDIGDVGIPGSATNSGDFLQISGAGRDIWGTQDSFHFVYQVFLDGELDAPPPSQDGTNPFAKIGLMIRESLDPASPQVILDVKPDGGVEFMTRATFGGETRFIAGADPPAQFPWWLRLIRHDGVVTAVICTGRCVTLGSVPFADGVALAGGAITSHDPSQLNHGAITAGVSLLPPWTDFDRGDVGLPGQVRFQDDVYEVQGAGADIWGTSDSYHFVANQMSGDGETIARVTAEYANQTFAKAGVIATDPVADGTTVILDIRPNGLIEFMARPSAGADMQFLAGASATFPVWLKLQRTGSQFTGSISSDGRLWQVVGTTTVAMPSDSLGGLAVTSHDTTSYNTSYFDHVLVASQLSNDSDVGAVGIAGNGALSGTVAVMQGGGGDIWDTADAFNYLYTALQDDGQIIALVSPPDDLNPLTHPFAKAGLMIRESLDPSAAQVMIDVTPSQLIEVLSRPATGAETQSIGGLSMTTSPMWLKLARQGTSVTASASSDGVNWTPLATTSPEIPGDALIGLAVTSHEQGVLTTAGFDSVSR
jgi:regulation of enolase protein 1 (concanavalin A-like superfamily)